MPEIALLDPSRKGREAEQFERRLRECLIGQDDAIVHIVEVYQAYLSGLAAQGRPLGNFLFLGPTGSGKTRAVEAMAEVLLNNSRAVLKIDCAEFQHSHEIAKLIGSPPGYLGHRETKPLLSQESVDRHHTDTVKISLVLFDEIEKANDALWNLLLGILDKATLTLGDNRQVDFEETMIFMTSNLGAAEMASVIAPKLGFHCRRSGSESDDPQIGARISSSGVEAARRRFSPEFMNRLDHVVVFKPLGAAELRRIIDIELENVRKRVQLASSRNPFALTVAASAKDFLLRAGTDARYGARPLKRAIERLLVHPLSNLIASGQIRRGDQIRVTHASDASGLQFSLHSDVEAFTSRPGRAAA